MKRILSVVLAVIITLLCFTSCVTDAERVDWSTIEIGKYLPAPASDLLRIYNDDLYDELFEESESIHIEVCKMSKNDYVEYQTLCEEKGFSVDLEKDMTSFFGYNKDGYCLALYYNEKSKDMSVRLDAPLELEEFSLDEEAIKANVPVPKSDKGEYVWESEEGFLLCVGDMTPEDYKEYKQQCIKNGYKTDLYDTEKYFFAKNQDNYKLSVEYRGYNTIYIELLVNK